MQTDRQTDRRTDGSQPDRRIAASLTVPLPEAGHSVYSVYLNIVLYNVFLLLSCFMHDEIKIINCNYRSIELF